MSDGGAAPVRRRGGSRVVAWWVVRLWRLAALLLAVGMLRVSVPPREETGAVGAGVAPWERIRQWLPEAVRLGPESAGGWGRPVLDGRGRRVGYFATTSPEADDLVGYSGPNNVLVVLDAEGRVAGMEWLTSGDTPAHVAEVRAAGGFWRAWTGWRPGIEAAPKVEAVAGSTLTSLGIAEAVERRLAGRSVSLRFPDPIALEEVRGTFAQAMELREERARPGWLSVRDGAGRHLGYAVRSSPEAERVRGHGGPTEALALLDGEGERVLAVRVRRSYDGAEYADRVREDQTFLRSLGGRTVREWGELDFGRAGIEGVSGATETSYALAEGLRRKLRAAGTGSAGAESAWFEWRLRDGALAGMVFGSLLMAFGGGRGRARVRRLWQVLVVGVIGLWLGDLLSVALLAGWSRHGLAADTAPGLVLLVVVALVVPWAADRALYCHHLCPHGVVQEWLAGMRRWQVAVPPRVGRWLERLAPGLLLVALLVGVAGSSFDLSRIEPFDAWTLRRAAWVSAGIALVGWVASVFVPMAYCRYGCPTGALLRFLRSSREERWGGRDTVALVLLLTAAGVAGARWYARRPSADPEIAGGSRVLAGRAFGTTWSVKLRGRVEDRAELERRLSSELERIESAFSHWRTNSFTASFNQAGTTATLEMPGEWVSLVARCQEISRASGGALDITVAPLVRAYGFGPGTRPETVPAPAELARLRERVGWEKLEFDESRSTVAKRHPELEVDLGAILQGYGVDRLGMVLEGAGWTNYLVEVGGELLARGSWVVAIEAPDGTGRVLRRVVLRDAALATSGTYRTRSVAGGRERSHLVDARSGGPVGHDTIMASVVHQSCALADAWATAVLVRGEGAGTRLPEPRPASMEVLTVHGGGEGWRVETTAGFPVETRDE